MPLSTLQRAASRQPAQDSRSGWSRFSFPVGLFHPLQHAGLSRRTLSPVYAPVYAEFGVQSWGLAVWRLVGLLCITVMAGYFGQPKRFGPLRRTRKTGY